jgi:hypothetical protein
LTRVFGIELQRMENVCVDTPTCEAVGEISMTASNGLTVRWRAHANIW